MHCIVVGFSLQQAKTKRLFGVDDVGNQTEINAKNINPYLVDANDFFINKRTNSRCDVTPMVRGSSPICGWNLLLNEDEKNELLSAYNNAGKYLMKFVGATEFIYNIPRYCLWLENYPPAELRKTPLVMDRVQGVKKMREESRKIPNVAPILPAKKKPGRNSGGGVKSQVKTLQ